MSRRVEVEIVEELSESEQREPLSQEELRLRRHLERRVERAQFEGAEALKELRDRRLFRSTHPTFELYCQARFGFTRRRINYLIAGSQVYDNLKMGTNGSQNSQGDDEEIELIQILPTNERQVRPLTKLEDPDQQREAWQLSVDEADGKLPSRRIVKNIVQRIRKRTPVPNPYKVGEVCQIIARDNPDLRGKGGCWCLVSEIHEWSCTVNTWDAEYVVRVEHLKSCHYSLEERQQIEELGVRMSQLYETGTLDEGALWVLKGLEKLHRSYLTPLEEKLLALLEQEYGITAS